jgi:hypothetical protein
MATAVGQLTIEMAANIVRLQQDMAGARKTVDGAMASIEKSVQTAMRTVSGLFAGVSIGAFAGKLVSVEREFGTLNASLVTVTGSARDADKAFALLTNFAATTPFSLQEVTAAFIKMKAMGLDASEAALRSYGNTASAMGKSLNQMIEAVADAATGEFERLKEFGIRAKSEGDRVTLTFRGVSTNIGKNAAEIEGYLRSIGDVDFAGAMDARAKTLDGAISNLGDSWDSLFRAINDEMTGPLLMAAVQSAQTAIVGLSAVVKNFTEFMDQNKVALLAFAAILAGPAIVSGIGAAATAFIALKTAVVGLTLAFASNPIALAILAITAAAVPAIVGIQSYMNANAALEKEQAGLNQTQAETERLLRQAAPVTVKAAAATDVLTDAQKKAIEEQKKQIANYQKLINDIEGKTGVMLAEQQQTEKLSESQKLALKIMQDIQNGTLKLNDAQKIKLTQSLEELLRTEAVNEEMKKQAESYKKVTKEIGDKTLALAEEQEGTENLTSTQKLALKIMQDIQAGTLTLSDAQKIKITQDLEELIATENLITSKKELASTQAAALALSDKINEEQSKQTESIRDNVVKLMEQNEELRFGKEAVAQRQIAVMRATATDLEFAAANEGGNYQLEEQARLLRQQADLAEDNTLLNKAKETADEWKKTSESIGNDLTDALMRGFESGKDFGKNLADTLVNMFKTLVLKPIIQPIAQGGANIILSMMGMALPGSAAAGGGGGGAAGMMQGLTLSMQAFGSTLGTGFMNTIFGTGGAGSMGAAQSMFSTGNYAQAAGMGAGTLAAYGAGAAVGVYGGRAISGGYAVSGSGNGMVNAGTAVGMVLGGPIGAAIGGAIAGGVNRLFGRKQTDMGIEGTLTTAEGIEGQSYQFLKGGLFRSNKTITSALASEVEVMFDSSIELITAQTKDYAKALGLPAHAIDNFTQDIKLSFQGLSEAEINQKIADALGGFQEGLAEQYAAVLEPLKRDTETFIQTLERLTAIQNVSAYLNEFGGAFSNFATASITARQGIVDLAGGLDALIQKTQGFVANFYTREEQAAITARGVVTALAQSGFTDAQIAALDTRADFRSLLESVDVNTDLGQKQFVALLNLQQQYANLAPVMEEQNKSLLELIDAAPQTEILQKMFESDVDYASRVADADAMAQETFSAMEALLGDLNVSVDSLSDVMGNGMTEIAISLESSQALMVKAIEQAQASAAATAAAQEAINAAAETERADYLARVEAQRVRDQEHLQSLIDEQRRIVEAALANASSVALTAVELTLSAAESTGLTATAAMGGYIDGPTLVGEHGPEMFDPRTSQIYTAPATSNMFGGNEMTAEIRALRDEVSMMRHETRSTAVNTAKIFRLQDNWDVRGLTVKTDVDQPLDTVTV